MKTKITLKTPLTLKNGDTIAELELRRPTWGEIKNLDMRNLNPGALLPIAADCAGQSEAILERLDGHDALEVCGVVMGFLDNSPTATS